MAISKQQLDEYGVSVLQNSGRTFAYEKGGYGFNSGVREITGGDLSGIDPTAIQGVDKWDSDYLKGLGYSGIDTSKANVNMQGFQDILTGYSSNKANQAAGAALQSKIDASNAAVMAGGKPTYEVQAPVAPPPSNVSTTPQEAAVSGLQMPNLSSLVGSRAVPGQEQLEFFNTQTGKGFGNPEELSAFVNQQLGNNATNPQNVFDFLKSQQSPAQQGLNAAKMSGPAPQDSGAARSAVQSFTPPQPPSTAGIDAQLTEDLGYQQLLKDQAEYNSVVNQTKSLTQEYEGLVKKMGVESMNTQLLNAQKIIDGTEEDIRAEVQSAGGFATDSQVQALANARNKQLIKNYNNLLNAKQMAMEQVNNMVNLASQDRSFALQTIQQKMQINEKLASYRDKFVSNAKEGYNNIINAVGYNGLYDMLKNNPTGIALVERTLGLGAGGLQSLMQAQRYQNNLADMQKAGITTRFGNKGGEIQDALTGYGYTSPQDFLDKTGLTLEQAQAKGMISNVVPQTKLDTKIIETGGRQLLINAQTGATIKDLGAIQKSSSGGGGGGTAGERLLSSQNTVINKYGSQLDQQRQQSSDGYANPDTYRQAKRKYIAAGGSINDFFQSFPIEVYVSPPNRKGDLVGTSNEIKQTAASQNDSRLSELNAKSDGGENLDKLSTSELMEYFNLSK